MADVEFSLSEYLRVVSEKQQYETQEEYNKRWVEPEKRRLELLRSMARVCE